MTLGIYKDDKGHVFGGLDNFMQDFDRDTLSSVYKDLFCFDFRPMGRTYASKKAYVREAAVRFSCCEPPDMSYAELAYITDLFSKLGKRFGLLREFRENGIC